jgi:hypothetical protein
MNIAGNTVVAFLCALAALIAAAVIVGLLFP